MPLPMACKREPTEVPLLVPCKRELKAPHVPSKRLRKEEPAVRGQRHGRERHRVLEVKTEKEEPPAVTARVLGEGVAQAVEACKDQPSSSHATQRPRRSRSRKVPNLAGTVKRERRTRRPTVLDAAPAVEPPARCKEEPLETERSNVKEVPNAAKEEELPVRWVCHKPELKAEEAGSEEPGPPEPTIDPDSPTSRPEAHPTEDDDACSSSGASTSVGSVMDCCWGPKEEDEEDAVSRAATKDDSLEDSDSDDVPEYTNEELGLLLLKPARDGKIRQASRFMIRHAGRRGGRLLRKRIPGDIAARLAAIVPVVCDLTLTMA